MALASIPIMFDFSFGSAEPRPEPSLRVEIALRKGEDPHVYDVDAKKEISGRVRSILLLPARQGLVTLELLQRDDKGKLVLTTGVDANGAPVDELAMETVEARLMYLRGDWEAR